MYGNGLDENGSDETSLDIKWECDWRDGVTDLLKC